MRRGIIPAVPRRTTFSGQVMVVLFVLFGSLLFFRALGALGISVFDSWPASTRFALAVMFLFTSSAHFNKFRHDLARMMPAIFPHPMASVYFTGICEILGAIGILVPQTRSLAGLSLVVFLWPSCRPTSRPLANMSPSPANLPRLFGTAFPCRFSSLHSCAGPQNRGACGVKRRVFSGDRNVWVNGWGISPLFVTRYSANSKFTGLLGSLFSFMLVGTSAPQSASKLTASP